MDRKQWKTKIKAAAKKAGTYQPFFDSIIDTLSGILERRDEAEQRFRESGGEIVTEHTNQGGATNAVINPALRVVNELNRDALAYWRDLGLTPAGLKKINDAAMKNAEKKVSSLEEALVKLSGGKES